MGESGKRYDSSLDAESAAALEAQQFMLAHRCPQTRAIKIRSYPQGGDFIEIRVCEACYFHYAADDLSEALK